MFLILSVTNPDGEIDKHYLVAESFALTELEVQNLHHHQLSGSLAEYLTIIIKNRDDSVLKILAADNALEMDKLIRRNPAFTEQNVAYQIYNSRYGNRVLVIYNTRRMVDFIEKRQLNPNASGQTGLLHKPESLAFDVDPFATHPWIKRLQGGSTPS